MNFIKNRITPICSDYETCSECFVRLMIYTGAINPNEITKLLEVEPTYITLAGDKITNSLGRTREVKNSGWFLSSEEIVNSKDLREHIDWIVSKISPFATNLKKIQEIKDIKLTLKCVWFSKFGHSGPVLWPEQMKALSDLDLECSFDIYFAED